MKTPFYDPDQAAQLRDGVVEVRSELYAEVDLLLGELSPRLTSEKANEYLRHGLCRRLHVMWRCVENVYSIYPPERAELLDRDARYDLQISLHAFVSHLVGALDNVAWVFVFERSLDAKLHRNSIGVFNSKTQSHMSDALRNHLQEEDLKSWWTDYAKNYRDALAHRIPLYVAPCYLGPSDADRYRELQVQIESAQMSHKWNRAHELEEEQESLGHICECFTHSFSDESARSIAFHPQILADTRTLLGVSAMVRTEIVSAA